MKAKTLTLGVVAAALTALAVPYGLDAWQERRGGGAIPVVVAAAVEPSVIALGEVLPVSDIVAIAAPSGQEVGRIAQVLVKEGDDVAQGAVVALLDTLPSRAAKRAQQEAAVKQREAALQKVRADIASNAAKLEAEIAQHGAERDKLAAQIERQERLTRSGVLDAASLADKKLDLQSADARLHATEVALQRTRLRGADGVYVDEASALADLASAKALLLDAIQDEDKARIRAPISGRILTLNSVVGEQIGNDGFADIGDVSTMLVRAEVFETDIEWLKVGDAAMVSSRSIQGEMAARITRIGSRITRQSITSTDPAETVDARVIEVWLQLDAAGSERIRNFSGLQVQVTFDSRIPAGGSSTGPATTGLVQEKKAGSDV
jgi:HlyD family secretion protein